MHSKSVCLCVFVCLFAFTMTPSLVAQSRDSKTRLADQDRGLIADDFSGDSDVPSDGSGRRTPQPSPGAAPDLSVFSVLKFSGTLTNPDGSPRTGVAGVTFAFYPEQSGGSPLWLETQNVTLDEQGRYTVLLGSASSAGLPLEVFSAGEARWLAVQSGTEPEQARIMLVSVPYAMKAFEADRLGGRTADEFVLTEQLEDAVDQKIRIGDDTTKNVDGASITGGSTAFGGGDTMIPVYTAEHVIGDSVIEQSSARIGINISPTLGRLHVLETAQGTTGVYGEQENGGGSGWGVKGIGDSPGGVGVLGQTMGTVSTAIGVHGIAGHANAIAGVFTNNNTTGQILSGMSSSTEVFSVNGDGDVVADGDVTSTTGVFTGDGSGLTDVIADDVDCTDCVDAADLAPGAAIGGSGTVDFIAMFDGVTQITKSVIRQDTATGRIGIGIAPDNVAKLRVHTTAAVHGIQGVAASTAESKIGVHGKATGENGTGVLGVATFAGAAFGVRGKVENSSAIAGMFNNTAGGQILSGQDNGAEVFSVEGDGLIRTIHASDATTSSGVSSGGLDQVASAWNSGSAAAEDQTFRWQADPTDNNDPDPNAKMVLSFASGAAAPSATGIEFTHDGYIKLAVSDTPDDGDCNAAAEVGRMKVDDDTATLHVCIDDAGSIGWGTVAVTP